MQTLIIELFLLWSNLFIDSFSYNNNLRYMNRFIRNKRVS